MRGIKEIGKEISSRLWSGVKRSGAALRSWGGKFWGATRRQTKTGATEVGGEVRKGVIRFIAQIVLYLLGGAIVVLLYLWGADPREWVERIKNPAVPHTFIGCVEDRETGMAIPGMIVGVENYDKQAATNEAGEYEITILARRTTEKFFLRVKSNEEYETQSRGKVYPGKKGPCIIDFQLDKIPEVAPSLTQN